MSRKRVAVIGSGASGLASIKSCLEEDLTPVCFERSCDIGGVWRYCDDVQEKASLQKSMTTNTSKEMMCFSDSPFPDHVHPSMHHSRVLDYLRSYADRFDLLGHIKFDHVVIKVARSADYAETGRWDVTYRAKDSSEAVTESFEGVMHCTGVLEKPFRPDCKGLSEFKGEVMHSKDYRRPERYSDKRVVVVGASQSAGDTAADLAPLASQVFLSCRHGAWLLPKAHPSGLPTDYRVTKRWLFAFMSYLPMSLITKVYMSVMKKNCPADLKMLGLEPQVWWRNILNDYLLQDILSGTVVAKPGIARLTERSVYFTDGTREDDVDAVIFATGYEVTNAVPLVEEGIVKTEGEWYKLFARMYPPDLPHHTLALLGVIRLAGAVIPVLELQARLAAAVIKGSCTLPGNAEMWKEINDRERFLKNMYAGHKAHTLRVDVVQGKDQLASLLGCKPSIGKLWLTAPRLAWACLFGPVTPYQYRLTGPHAWPGAPRAILTQDKRMLAGFNTRVADTVAASSNDKDS